MVGTDYPKRTAWGLPLVRCSRIMLLVEMPHLVDREFGFSTKIGLDSTINR